MFTISHSAKPTHACRATLLRTLDPFVSLQIEKKMLDPRIDIVRSHDMCSYRCNTVIVMNSYLICSESAILDRLF